MGKIVGLCLYVIWDRVAQAGSSLLAYKNDAVATRAFHQMLHHDGKDNPNESDYELLHVGFYNNEGDGSVPLLESCPARLVPPTNVV